MKDVWLVEEVRSVGAEEPLASAFTLVVVPALFVVVEACVLWGDGVHVRCFDDSDPR